MNTRDGKSIVYHIYGPTDGAPMVLIHGLGADHQMWRPQIETYPENGLRLIVPDMRSHGESDWVDNLELEDWVEDLREILDAEDISRAGVIGVSMGGVIAQQFAIRYPRRLDKLVLCDTFHELRGLRYKLVGAATVFAFRLYRRLGKEKLVKAMASTYEDPTVRNYFTYAMNKNDLDQLALARKAINTIDAGANLARVDTPTLVLVGRDFGGHFVKISRRLAGCLPNATLVELTGAKDPSNLVNPAAFDEQVLPFLVGDAGTR